MSELTPDFILDEIPGAESIRMFREKAAEDGAAVRAAYRSAGGKERVLVVSERGTCVVIADGVSAGVFNREEASDVVAGALQTPDD